MALIQMNLSEDKRLITGEVMTYMSLKLMKQNL